MTINFAHQVESSGVEDPELLCTVCMCVSEQAEKYVYELCGHPICKPCLADQLRSSDFPIKCNREVRTTYELTQPRSHLIVPKYV